MSRFTGLMLCVVAASLNSVHVNKADAPNLRDLLKPVLEACMSEYKVTQEDINRAAETGDPNIIDPCYSGCVFKKTGLINDEGQYDLVTGLANLRKIVKDDEHYNKLKEVSTQCTTRKIEVTDGKSGCQRGGLLSACFLENKAIVRI